MAPCSSRTHLRAAQAPNCLLMLSRVMPTISPISCWVMAIVRLAGSSLRCAVRPSSALASRPGRSFRMSCSTCSLVRRSRAQLKVKSRCSGRGSRKAKATTLLLIQLEDVLVIEFQVGILLFLFEITILDNENIQFRPHETSKRVLRIAYDRFSSHVKARVDEHGATRQLLEARKQRMIFRIGRFVDGLNARGIVDVRN